MKIFSGGRQNGKTLKLIQHAAEHGLTIVVCSYRMIRPIKSKATKMGLTIPEPISYSMLDSCVRGADGLSHVAIDNVEWVLDALLREKHIVTHACTVTTDEVASRTTQMTLEEIKYEFEHLFKPPFPQEPSGNMVEDCSVYATNLAVAFAEHILKRLNFMATKEIQ